MDTQALQQQEDSNRQPITESDANSVSLSELDAAILPNVPKGFQDIYAGLPANAVAEIQKTMDEEMAQAEYRKHQLASGGLDRASQRRALNEIKRVNLPSADTPKWTKVATPKNEINPITPPAVVTESKIDPAIVVEKNLSMPVEEEAKAGEVVAPTLPTPDAPTTGVVTIDPKPAPVESAGNATLNLPPDILVAREGKSPSSVVAINPAGSIPKPPQTETTNEGRGLSPAVSGEAGTAPGPVQTEGADPATLPPAPGAEAAPVSPVAQDRKFIKPPVINEIVPPPVQKKPGLFSLSKWFKPKRQAKIEIAVPADAGTQSANAEEQAADTMAENDVNTIRKDLFQPKATLDSASFALPAAIHANTSQNNAEPLKEAA